MTHARPLPAPLDQQPFAVADAIAQGITYQRLRVKALRRPHRGVRSSGSPETVDEAAAELAAIAPRPFAFAGMTAARLLGLPLHSTWHIGEPLHVIRPTHASAVRRPGVVGHRGLESRATEQTSHGLPVTSAPDTWADLATKLPLDWLIVVGDAVVAHGTRHATADLAAAVRRRMRGRVRATTALEEIREGFASPMETLARLLLVRGGLPEPQLSADILDRGGHWLACVDLYWPESRLVVEYDGDLHRVDRVQWQADIRRRRRIEAAGYRVLVITADDLVAGARACIRLVGSFLRSAAG